jgi:hypothetical protein
VNTGRRVYSFLFMGLIDANARERHKRDKSDNSVRNQYKRSINKSDQYIWEGWCLSHHKYYKHLLVIT